MNSRRLALLFSVPVATAVLIPIIGSASRHSGIVALIFMSAGMGLLALGAELIGVVLYDRVAGSRLAKPAGATLLVAFGCLAAGTGFANQMRSTDAPWFVLEGIGIALFMGGVLMRGRGLGTDPGTGPGARSS